MLLGMPVSFRTLIRMLSSLDDQPVTTPKVLGVDDWSIKKGTSYATILVDIERQRPIELLLERKADTLSDWLKKYPGVEVITRDRSGSYAEGARTGSPNAVQVADRWHLIKNLGEALKRMLERYPAKGVAKRASTVLSWKDYLIKRWSAGEHSPQQLWREIQVQGFASSLSSVRRFLNHFHKESNELSLPELEVKNWSPTRVQFLLSKPKGKLREEEQVFLKVLFQHVPRAKVARKLALEFHTIFQEKHVAELPNWIEQAKVSGISVLENFATSLVSDYAAVEATAIYQRSNGPVEGYVSRGSPPGLKMIKREMYGRARFHLLRNRVLFYPDTS